MSRIIHSEIRPLWQRPAVIGAVVAALAVLAAGWGARDAGRGDEPAAPSIASPTQGATPSGAAGASMDDSFPSLRLALLEVSLSTVPPSAALEVEGRRVQTAMGQEVFPGVRLDRVFSDRVVLVHGTSSRTLRIAPPAGAPAGATAAAEGEDPNEIRVRNKAIDPKLLTRDRPMAADAFLREVLVSSSPRGGFVVEEVMPGSVYDKLGLRRGDVVFSLDVPGTQPVDESSMIALMQQTSIELEVYRNGAPVRLKHDLTAEPEADADTSR